jgi:hypothetical protein
MVLRHTNERGHYRCYRGCVLGACCYPMISMPKKKKLSVNEAAAKLAAIAEKSLSRFSEKEQDARVEAFARRDLSGAREIRAKSSRSSRTRRYQAAGRGR